MYNTKADSAASATSPLAPTTIARRDPTEREVQIEILVCGICHSDLHSVCNEWSEFMPTVESYIRITGSPEAAFFTPT